MSQRINQPVQSVRLTNVAVVRINRHGLRFEIACYKNKVVNYRQGLETDLSEVLQSDRIFTNVSKGQFAKSSQLQKAFGTTDEEEVAKIILEKGDLQIGDKEREQFYESTVREIANWVAANCVNPSSQRPYTTTQVRNAMRQAEFRVNPNKAVKPQCLECVKLLQSTDYINIERAKMELCIKASVQQEQEIVKELEGLHLTPNNKKVLGNECLISILVDPSLYRPINKIAKDNGGRLEILRQVVTQEGDANLDAELQRKKVSSNATSNIVTAVDQAEEQLKTLQVSEQHDTAAKQEEHDVASSQQDDVAPQYDNASASSSNMRKHQKKAQKQSKKAKRREKEEAAERQARIDAEKKRQEQRAMERGDVVSGAGASKPSTADTTTATQKSCNTCGGSFDTVALYRAHFRSDWHRYNVKLKMKGIPPVSEKEFILCDSDAFFEDTM